MNLEKYRLIDQALLKIACQVRLLDYLEPVNEEEEKRKFLAGDIRNPRFKMKDLEYNPEKVKKELFSIKIPQDELGELFWQKRENISQRNEMIKRRDKKGFIRVKSIESYGIPEKKLVNYADELLKKRLERVSGKTVSSRQVKKALESALADYGLDDWAVEFSDKRLTAVYTAEKKICVCRNRKFAHRARVRLIIHEVGVHVLRAANGYRQPLRIFALGLPKSLATEEGMTLFFEEQNDLLSQSKMGDYAARVIGVDSVCQGLNFRRAFERLKAYRFTDESAWNLTVRVYRGGGFLKDQVYLKGFLAIKEFAKKDGDFNTLYLGKIGIEHLPLVRKLLGKGILNKAEYLPKFL